MVQCYVIRSDLTSFRYLDAAMNQDGLWSAPVPDLPAGSYRAFVTFAAPDAAHGTPLLYDLSQPLTVTGPVAAPATTSTVESRTSTVDGYTATLAGTPTRGRTAPLTLTVMRNGHPIESLNRYLDGYAHLTAFHAGDLARARIAVGDRDRSGRRADRIGHLPGERQLASARPVRPGRRRTHRHLHRGRALSAGAGLWGGPPAGTGCWWWVGLLGDGY